MHWYLVHTKPRQEKVALQNLQQQDYQCYLPILPTEKLRQGVLTLSDEPLFPRYLFIQLARNGSIKSWAPIRSTKGVSRLVSFGAEAVKVSNSLIDLIKSREASLLARPERLFAPGERVHLTEGAFAGLEGIYQMPDGERRAMVLIEILSRPVTVSVTPASLRKML